MQLLSVDMRMRNYSQLSLLLVSTSCIFLFLKLHFWSFNDINELAIEDPNGILTQPGHEQPFFTSASDKKPLSIYCNSCAVVTSSGHLLQSNAGGEIDSHQCVIRTNDSPVISYEHDIGTRTTIRIVGFPSRNNYNSAVQKQRIREPSNGIIIAWGPQSQIGIGKPYSNMIKTWQRDHPTVHYYEFTQQGIEWADNLYQNLTGVTRMGSGIWLSTGFFTMLFAKKICGTITVYGMTDPSYCTKLKLIGGEDVPYHYYSDTVKECAHINRQKADAMKRKGGHKFDIEKTVFQNWARTDGNIIFKIPNWS